MTVLGQRQELHKPQSAQCCQCWLLGPLHYWGLECKGGKNLSPEQSLSFLIAEISFLQRYDRKDVLSSPWGVPASLFLLGRESSWSKSLLLFLVSTSPVLSGEMLISGCFGVLRTFQTHQTCAESQNSFQGLLRRRVSFCFWVGSGSFFNWYEHLSLFD